MSHKLSRFLSWLLISILLIAVVPWPVLAAPPGQSTVTCVETYTIQADDWLSKISAKFLGDMLAYPALVAATNQQHVQDSTFAQITNPDVIEVGWKICVPSAEEAQALLLSSATMGGEVMVADALGRTLIFPQQPQRFVFAGRANTLVADAFYMFPEASQRLAGIERGNQSGNDFLAVIDPAYGDKIFLEQNVGPEQIAPLKPDVVLLKSFMAEKLGQPLEQLGISVVYVDLETPEQYDRDIAIMGQLLGNPARAREILNFYQQRVDRVRQAMAGLTAEQKPNVLLLQYSDRGGEVAFNVPPATWLQTTMTELAGGTPVWTEAAEKGGWTVVGFEQIAAWNPDQIYVINYFADPVAVVEQLKTDPKWQELKAVQNNQLYAFAKDFYSWDQPDTRWILGLQWLATKIQPERAAGIDLQEALNEFYTQMYGLDPATIQAEVTPLLKGL
ncbi:MAG: ABC transporter substrate-binding protein [Anaerolineae bacterium]|nr:ABC transporter substrate-binding protein [Anaerolineae bacterium]